MVMMSKAAAPLLSGTAKYLLKKKPMIAAGQAVAARSFASVGDKLPSVELHQGFPPKKYDLAAYAKDKSIILLGLPGVSSLQ